MRRVPYLAGAGRAEYTIWMLTFPGKVYKILGAIVTAYE